jgi:hypothetical protein
VTVIRPIPIVNSRVTTVVLVMTHGGVVRRVVPRGLLFELNGTPSRAGFSDGLRDMLTCATFGL